MSKFIEVHDIELKTKKTPQGPVVRVRKSSIDAIGQRRDYTTLYVRGAYIHVAESADWVQNKCEEKEER